MFHQTLRKSINIRKLTSTRKYVRVNKIVLTFFRNPRDDFDSTSVECLHFTSSPKSHQSSLQMRTRIWRTNTKIETNCNIHSKLFIITVILLSVRFIFQYQSFYESVFFCGFSVLKMIELRSSLRHAYFYCECNESRYYSFD